MSNKFLFPIFAIALLFSLVSISSVNASAESYQVPTPACELSRTYPTLVFKVDAKNALTQGLLLVDCSVDYVFPAITANPDFYTPIGQYTIDYPNMKKLALLTWEEKGYRDLKTPNWMPYAKDVSTGDFGQDIWRNNFGVHSAPWRWSAEFTGNRELTLGGTHGCTNLNNTNSNWLYNRVLEYKNAGQKVKVYNYN